MRPPSTKKIVFQTKDGVTHNGFFLKDANRYVRNVNRWKDTDTNVWYDDSEVISYRKEREL